MQKQPISIHGARTHNLKNISFDLPRNKLIVITGVSGSGKSSLAFDTLYAEGQRRYVESLSAYARQFLERMDRPDVDNITGIPPAVAIEQKNPTRSTRSTVATATEVLDYMRLLFARIGHTFCPSCGNEVQKDSVQDVVDKLLSLPSGTKIFITYPCSKSNDCDKSISILKSKGFYRIYYQGNIISLDEGIPPDLQNIDSFSVLVDRIIIKDGLRDRLTDSISTAFSEGHGRIDVHIIDGSTLHFSQANECAQCNKTFIEPQPRLFSFNNPFGACVTCKGFGDIIRIDENLVIPDQRKSLAEGAIAPLNSPTHSDFLHKLLRVVQKQGVDINTPYANLQDEEKKIIWNGVDDFRGINGFFEWLETKKYKIGVRVLLSRYRGYSRCPSCNGTRLRSEAMNVRIAGKHIGEINQMTISETHSFFESVQLSPFEQEIAGKVLAELINRLHYLDEIGLGYLTLNRRTSTLSGGEYQRINLATALGSKLVGSLYILDEPTIGLHRRDTQRLIMILKALRDIGNTVVVVEHDKDIMAECDRIVDLGPRAGELGGEIVYDGTYKGIRNDGRSITGAYLRGNKQIPLPDHRRHINGQWLKIIGAGEHNLKNIDVDIPLGVFVVITGVSGSGKSSLIHDVLFTALQKRHGKFPKHVGKHHEIRGAHLVDNVVMVDQSPIGKTPRSNPATYVKAFDSIRRLFANSKKARIRGLQPSAFSFNVPGGRCDTCNGAGSVKIEMQFLSDLYLECDMCGGARYKKEILEVMYRGKNIADVLSMSVDEALTFFADDPKVTKNLKLLADVGMGYVKLGQPATTLSGGEAQRVKLAAHLGDRKGTHSLYIFDEATTGLHFDDIVSLLSCFDSLIEAGNSVLVIEHNMDVIKCADYIIDLGPEGGEKGGEVVAYGTPEELTREPRSHTGMMLRDFLDVVTNKQ